MYYIGTQAECVAYNLRVGEGEKYNDTTTQWGKVIVEGERFAIIKHPRYEANLETISILTPTII